MIWNQIQLTPYTATLEKDGHRVGNILERPNYVLVQYFTAKRLRAPIRFENITDAKSYLESLC